MGRVRFCSACFFPQQIKNEPQICKETPFSSLSSPTIMETKRQQKKTFKKRPDVVTLYSNVVFNSRKSNTFEFIMMCSVYRLGV